MNTKAPYNISTPTASLALSALSPSAVIAMREKVAKLIASRRSLLASLAELAPLGLGPSIGGNEANFVVVPVLEKNGSGLPDSARAQKIYKTLAELPPSILLLLDLTLSWFMVDVSKSHPW